MPFYQVYHSTPLDNLQRDALAKAITNAHSGTTGALKIFVNIDFHHNTNPYQYVGGIRRPNNKIIGLLRPRGDVIGEELMKDIMKEIQEAWNEIVGSEGEQELSVIWLNDSLKTGMEFGILLPKVWIIYP